MGSTSERQCTLLYINLFPFQFHVNSFTLFNLLPNWNFLLHKYMWLKDQNIQPINDIDGVRNILFYLMNYSLTKGNHYQSREKNRR